VVRVLLGLVYFTLFYVSTTGLLVDTRFLWSANGGVATAITIFYGLQMALGMSKRFAALSGMALWLVIALVSLEHPFWFP
jgi:hypothetical protein